MLIMEIFHLAQEENLKIIQALAKKDPSLVIPSKDNLKRETQIFDHHLTLVMAMGLNRIDF